MYSGHCLKCLLYGASGPAKRAENCIYTVIEANNLMRITLI